MSEDDRITNSAENSARPASPALSETTSNISDVSSSAGSLSDSVESKFTQTQVDEVAVVEEILALLTTPYRKVSTGSKKQTCRIDIAVLVEAVLGALKPDGAPGLFKGLRDAKAFLTRRKKAMKLGLSTTLPSHSQGNWCNKYATGLESEGRRRRQTLTGFTFDAFDVKTFDGHGKAAYTAKIVEALFDSNQIVLPDDLEYCKPGEEKTKGRRQRGPVKRFMQDKSAVETLALTLWASIVNPDTAKDVFCFRT